MSEAVTTAFLALIDAATAVPVKSGERRAIDTQAAEPDRPYVRVTFVTLGQKLRGSPRKLRGSAVVEIFGESGVDAWAVGSELLAALGLSGAVCAPARPNPIDSYELVGALNRGNDPGNGALVFATIAFHYF